MARKRTTPEPVATAHADTLESFAVQIAYDKDLKIRTSETMLVYVIKGRDGQNVPVTETQEAIQWNALPQVVKTAVKRIATNIMADAESKGYVGAGEDEDDLP